uniref:Ig-like domain-containing protein n=1 Tax=Rattus norvegicus TaxID=10116 RepID=A0ABK0M3D1_RAT
MDSSPGFVAVILLLLGRTRGDSVTQTEGQVTISENGFLRINCTYSATSIGYPTLFWYFQYPGESLQLLLKVITAGEKGSSKGFEATYNKETTSFHLQKASVQESDSAMYYCALGDTVAETTGGAEHKPRGNRWSDC